jgi:serine protease inhibitor
MESQGTGGSPTQHPDVEAVVQGNTEFALDLYRQLRTQEGNLFFSPYSVSTALAMTYGGARGNTQVEMAHTLRFTLGQARLHPALASLKAALNAVQAKGNVQLKVANALWPQEGYTFLDEYLALVEEYYRAAVTALNYGDAETARTTINTWIEQKTAGKIRDLIPAGILDAMTRLVLTNAIYFKGDWAKRFHEARTTDAPFWVTPAASSDVPMMSQVETLGYSAREPGLQVLELPYAGHDLSMIVLLPDERDGIAALEDALTVENLTSWIDNLRPMEVEVHLPRFKLSCQFGLGNMLKAMGMVDAFDYAADFSGMDGTKSLYISAIIHQASVDVNEEGTEAAAATAVVMKLKALPLPPPVFRADHPFMFLIRENQTGSILFIGRMANPQARAT